MSKEDVRERVNDAMRLAVAENVPLDDLEAILDDAQKRVDKLRALEGEA